MGTHGQHTLVDLVQRDFDHHGRPAQLWGALSTVCGTGGKTAHTHHVSLAQQPRFPSCRLACHSLGSEACEVGAPL